MLFILLCWMMKAPAQNVDSLFVFFDFDKHLLNTSAISILKKLDSTSSSIQKIYIEAHTDQLGSVSYNDALSTKRLQAIEEYLTKTLKIPSELIIQKNAYGEKQLLYIQTSENFRKWNRRGLIVVEYLTQKNKQVVPPNTPAPPNTTTLKELIKDSSVQEGTQIVLQNLNFYGGRHVLLPESKPVLLELLEVMRTYPSLIIEIHGHICCGGNSTSDGLDLDTGEMRLSFNRAKAVYLYLIEHGIDANRMSFKGFGHQFPLVRNEVTDEDKTANRRVEIKIIKK